MKELLTFLSDNSIAFRENEPMSEHTTFRIGGKARLFVTPRSLHELSLLLKKCAELKLDCLTVGNGSNLLVSDSGVERPVLKLSGEFEKIVLLDETTVYASAGAMLVSVCNCALENSLTGLEFAYGIPGSVGGAAFMNAGAYGGEMRDVVAHCDHVDRNGEVGRLSASELSYGYRKSAYTENGFVITGVCFALKRGSRAEIEAKMADLLGRRKSKQPLSLPSAGSVFKRPEGHFAGALIEQAGLKGCSVGGAQVSEKHAGFIVNTGGATCKDVKALIEHCQSEVFDRFGVALETEIKMI